ncbi:MAG: hypothetical protein PHC88_05485 [Terrimicrobiaceae bacterium]|nr:hypothetical protein [Terrimicrobiaceae bacterium]
MLIYLDKGQGKVDLLVDARQCDQTGDTTTVVVHLSEDDALALRGWLDDHRTRSYGIGQKESEKEF